MRQFLFLSFVILLTIGTSYAQNSVNSAPEKRHFRITSFLVDGREVSGIKVLFLLNGKEIVPDNKDGVILVPDEMVDAPWEKSGMRFTAPSIDFVLENVVLQGYLDSDNVTSDYKISIDTTPIEINKQVSKLSIKEKRSLGIRTYKDVCEVNTLTASNIVVKNPNPNLIVDPVTSRGFKLCKRKIR